MQAAPQEKLPVAVVLDFSLRSVGDVVALAALHGLATGRGSEAAVGAVNLTRAGLESAAYCDAVGRYYNRLYLREFPARFQRYRGLAVGLEPSDAETPPFVQAVLGKKTAAGEPLYPHEVLELNDTADSAALIRNAMTAEQDGNVVVVLAGPASSLARVMGLNGAMTLIEQKVRALVVALGDLPNASSSPLFATDVSAARKVFADWPSPIVFAGGAIGEQAPYPGGTLEADFSWADDNPVLDAYRAGGHFPYDAPSSQAAAVLHAVRPDAGYFELSEPGRVTVTDDGALKFGAAADGRCRYLTLDPSQRPALLEAYRKVVSSMPATRELPDFLKRIVEEEEKDKPAQ